MIVGKGSLFLGRMTNLFDGVSVIIERNKGIEEKSSMNKEEINKIIAEVMKKIGDQLLNQ
jgi:betaine reductase